MPTGGYLILGIPRMNMLKRTTKTMPVRMGHAQEQLPDIKNIRVSPPEKYAGEDDIENNKKDFMRVDLCGIAVTGLAATWNERSERSNIPKSTGSTSTPQQSTLNNRTNQVSNQEATPMRNDYPLNKYEEYIKVEDDEDEDPDIVYIHAVRASTDEELVEDVADTSSVSNGTPTTVESTNTSIDLTDILSDMTPNELLLTLSKNTWIEIYMHCKTQEEPNWTPPKIKIDVKRRKYSSKVGNKLLRMGYTYNEEELDSEWIQSLTVRDPIEFQELTGYWVPTQVQCESCRECTPDIREMIVCGEDSEVYTRSIIRCNNDTTEVIIRAMTEAPESTRAYRSSMRRPMGTMTRPIRENDEDLCLAAYVTMNRVKAYTLFDSESTTDAVSPNFTHVVNVPIYELEKPLTLQLGCAGSRSKINFGTESHIKFSSIANNTYLDIANLDKYDSILGTPFLRKHGIMLDFDHNEIVICGKMCIPALPKGEGAAVANNSPRKIKKGT
ncbi:hypothetical protein PILCRDRAFT_16386 [Piloderma croceum F 1598]|uniref:Aspartic peptidase DDI1-type domain-containing protein n=1 Tax=Piloderma croceum (strain F 1598) TaxID=765440 RepID=A0A0C3B4G8_PILCF|nr:hypothetical protein PILCRDRAFT_16386 [Piloderma croceum F 1598]